MLCSLANIYAACELKASTHDGFVWLMTQKSAEKREMRICGRNSPVENKVGEEGEEDAPHAEAEIPLQPVVQTMVRQLCP